MDFRQLRTFLNVAQLGSLSRAAEHLHTAQPALGRQVKLLEDELGVALFSRHARGMVLTAAGHTLVERATTILRLVDETRAEIAAGRDAITGTVSLGVPPTAGEVIAGPLVERFRSRHPQVRVRIVPAFSGYLLDMLQWGEVDLAVMYRTDDARALQPEPLILEPLFLIGPDTSPLAPGDPVPFVSLDGVALILPGPRHGLRRLIEDEARPRGFALDIAVEADSLQTLKDLVVRGLGHTVLPFAAVRPEVEAGTLRAAPLSEPALIRELVLARSVVKPASNAVRLFADDLKSQVAAMVASGEWQGTLRTGEADA